MKKTIPRRQRHDWIYRWIHANPHSGANVLNAEFVDAYLDFSAASFSPTLWGAHRCRQLGRDLGDMYRRGMLRRFRIGLSGGTWQPGFPTWVWSYEADSRYADLFEHLLENSLSENFSDK